MPAPSLTPHQDAPGRWRVDLPKSLSSSDPPRRVRRFFPTRAAAEEFAQQARKQIAEVGTQIPLLSYRQMADAAEALRLLDTHYAAQPVTLTGTDEHRPSLTEMARDWLDQWRKTHQSHPLDVVYDEFVTVLEKRRRVQPKHLKSLGYTRSLLAPLALRGIRSVTADQLEDCLAGIDSRSSYNAHLRRINSVMNYAVRKRYVTENPAAQIDYYEGKRKPVPILRVEEVGLMLRLASQHYPRLIPFLTVALFAGVRVEEINRLVWSDIHWQERVLVIREDVSKTGERRRIDLPANLLEWLVIAPAATNGSAKIQPLAKQTLRRQRRRLWQLMRQADASLPASAPQNCLRHSYCSYHLAVHNNIVALIDQTGHSSEVMFRHYRSRVEEAEAARYWAIMP